MSMRPDKQIPPKESTGRKRRMNWDLYYYEQQGNRFYKRYTRFALILTIIGGLIVIALLVALSIFDPGGQSKNEPKATMPSPSPSASSYPMIRQAPPPTTPRIVKQSKSSFPSLPSPSTPAKNGNEQLTPQQTPSPQPSTPPP